MEVITPFDYNHLDTETRIIVQQRTGELKALMRNTVQGILDIGERLADVRTRLRHDKAGGFDNWLSTEFDWSRRTAYSYIKVFEEFGNRANFAQLDIAPSALYLLADPSTSDEVREEMIDRAEQGDKITHQKVKTRKTTGGIDKTVTPQLADTSPIGHPKSAIKHGPKLTGMNQDTYSNKGPAHTLDLDCSDTEFRTITRIFSDTRRLTVILLKCAELDDRTLNDCLGITTESVPGRQPWD